MTNQGPPGGADSINNDDRVATLLHQLRDKLSNFTIIDRQGQPVGKVDDLYLDASRQLKLVISLFTALDNSRWLLSSKLIQDVDPASHSLYVNISQAELDRLPQYQQPEVSPINAATEMSGSRAVMPGGATEVQLDRDQPAFELQTPSMSEAMPGEVIRLLAERLIVNRTKRKVGEVIVRKVVETEFIEVPVRREKLIVEQVSPELKQIAEIDLGLGDLSGIELSQPQLTQATVNQDVSVEPSYSESKPMVRGEFTSPKAAGLLLEAIALQRQHGCTRIRVEIELENASYQETYQAWIDRSSDKADLTGQV